MTDKGFSIFLSKKVPAFQRKKLKKLVFWDDGGRKIILTKRPLLPLRSFPVPPVSCLLSPTPTKRLFQQTLNIDILTYFLYNLLVLVFLRNATKHPDIPLPESASPQVNDQIK
ncbi:hypothetical protein D4Z78_05180 [Okeania hirsuta]|nr:hypothetical protein D4Z78_05180 [Okeania hirsuta]